MGRGAVRRVRLRERRRAARLHPAARTRWRYRLTVRHLVTFGVQAVRYGMGTVADFLAAFVVATVAKFCGGIIPGFVRRVRLSLSDLLGRLAARLAVAAAYLAAVTVAAAAELRTLHHTDTRPAETPVRGPGRTTRPALLGGHVMRI